MELLGCLSQLLNVDFSSFVVLVFDNSPRFQSRISSGFGSVQPAIGAVKVPVSDFDIGNHVLQSRFEVGDFLIGVDSRDHDRHSIDEGSPTSK